MNHLSSHHKKCLGTGLLQHFLAWPIGAPQILRKLILKTWWTEFHQFGCACSGADKSQNSSILFAVLRGLHRCL